ncbi:hypothetical protein VM98_35060 [Streptomyces rubellomurinus subsp. indigoferus]|nr:hypothetical protein VM98_35060 [Streptomyces rubellomurinus subsp. indigoferus]
MLMAWSQHSQEHRVQLTWNMLLLIWQLMGHSVRDAVPTRFAFMIYWFSPCLAPPDSTSTTDTP